ncbi:hypothetical protein BDF22DRAFT_743811 [Syncephalis plumigaleata]|nr:hypothetical protein BDF22DRAFT_743811 [Syncephalis plumigaleata]
MSDIYATTTTTPSSLSVSPSFHKVNQRPFRVGWRLAFTLGLAISALTGPCDTVAYHVRRGIGAWPVELRCNTELAICLSNRIQDTRFALEKLSKQLDNASQSSSTSSGSSASANVDQQDLLAPLRFRTSNPEADSADSEMQGTTPLTVSYCEWFSCASIRLRESLPSEHGSKEEQAIVAVANDRIKIMINYINYNGRIASDSCDTMVGHTAYPTDSNSAIVDKYGLVVRYWQKSPEAGKCRL